jgi:hypothetical protein
MNFQEDLKNSIFNTELDRTELLTDIFKSFVAKLFEHVLSRKKNNQSRLSVGELVEVKRNLINEFRTAPLAEHQKSVEWYDNLFETTVKEIFESAQHQGIETVQRASQNFEINAEAYKMEGGLYLPK